MLWLSRSHLASIASEATAKAPLETGGILLGYWATVGVAAVITEVVGPGPAARHRAASFSPDHTYQEARIEFLYSRSEQPLEYLGDWHSHPGGTTGLSSRDWLTLREIARHKPARAPRPIMLIVAGGPDWDVGAWLGADNGRLARRKFEVRQLELRLYSFAPEHR